MKELEAFKKMRELLADLLAVIGALFIAFGSWVAYLAPGDGQTGMVCYPAWGLGGFLGIAATTRIFGRGTRSSLASKIVVALLAIVALATIAIALGASITYSRTH